MQFPLDSQGTVAQLADLWLADAEQRLRPKSVSEYRRLMRIELLPRLGHLRADGLGRRDVAQALAQLSERPGIQRNAHTTLSAMFAWGIASCLLDGGNPVEGLRKPCARARERVLAPNELRVIWQAVEPMGDYGRIVRLLTLTGGRRQEIGGLLWSEVQERPDGPVIALPSSRTKNRRPHLIPLVPAALALLAPRRAGYPHVFGRVVGRGFDGWGKCRAILAGKIAGLANWTLHDLRRSFATYCCDHELAEPHIVEAALGHVGGHKAGVAGTYNRAAYLGQRRTLAERWAAELARIVSA